MALMATPSLFAGVISTSPSLPPANGVYVANVGACYSLAAIPTTACLQNGRTGGFLNSLSDFITSPGNQLSTFDTALTATLSSRALFHIDSFFDIFMEISIDRGLT
jgi:hypothetical protein